MLHRYRHTLALLWLIGLAWGGQPAAAQTKPTRFTALLANGERVEGNGLQNWHDMTAQPLLDGKPLMDPSKPLRWWRDRAQLPGPAPRAFVEMHSGDRLPGVVVDYSAAGATGFDAQLAHFRVKPEVDLRPQVKVQEPQIRVVASFVRRIVWQKRDRDEFEPNTVFFRDGRSTPFRAARFGQGYVNLLLSEGNRRVAFSEMAEIHLAAVDPWQSYFDEVAVLDAENQNVRLYQIQTTEGLIVTGSYARRQFYAMGNPQEFARWVHGLQPAWSLDVLYIPTDDIWARRMWLTNEVPLTRIRPSSAVTRSPLSATGRTPKLNTNVDGGPLRSGTLDFGWGYGVHAHTELAFPLPVGVKALRGLVALDRIAGKGGCVRARVYVNATTTPPLWESPFLVGSDTVADLGAIPLTGPAQNQKTIILQVDAAHAGRPAGADPLDVRDAADWLDPWLELDPVVVRAEINKRLTKQFAAWQDWTPAVGTPDGELQWTSYWNDLNGVQPGNYRFGVAPRKQPLLLSRELKVGPSDNWLVVFANRATTAGTPPKIEVRIGGEPVAEYEVPFRQRGNEDQPPLAVRLVNYQVSAKPVHVEIRQLALPDQGAIDWRGIEVVEQLPHLNQVFQDQGVFTAINGEQKGGAKLVSDERYYGTHAVQITPDGQFRLNLPQPLAIREQPKWGEYRHIRFAVRKQGDGRVALEVDRAADASRPARYDLGTGEPVGKSAIRVWNQNLPNEWIVTTRDLYADYGTMDATGITIQAPDGQSALFDHVYLARRPEDFNLIPGAPPPDLTNQVARRELAKPILDKGFPAIVMIQTKDGRVGSGVITTADGEVLTAGHVVANPNEECTVHLADGRAVKGLTRGIARDFDLGLIKITDAGPFPFVERGNAKEVPENQLYVGFAHGKAIVKSAKPAAHILGIRRVFRGMIWTDFETPEWSAGGPLLTRENKVIGILTKRSEFGGFLFGRLEDIEPPLIRLRNGEVYGAWYPGLGPMFGLNVQSTREGAKVLEVYPNSPAASANLKAGDVVTKVDGRSVVSLEDMYAVLGEKNPGQECTLDYFRSGQMLQAKLLLVPRTP
jgi:S1-C subfamily serine protease